MGVPAWEAVIARILSNTQIRNRRGAHNGRRWLNDNLQPESMERQDEGRET